MEILVGALATFGVLWLARRLYGLAVAAHPQVNDFRMAEDAEGSDLLEVAASHTGSPILRGNEIELLINGDRIFPPMLDAIRGATETVEFLTFVYWTGDIAEEMATALAEAAARGVQVRVLLDAFGSKEMDTALLRQMEQAGCKVAHFHPLTWRTLHRYNYRTHRKVLVVDGHIGFTGGVGIAEEWAGDAQDPDSWRDNHFRLEGPVVRFLHGAFAENWRTATGEVLSWPGGKARPTGGTGRVVPFLTAPRGRDAPIGFLYWLMLQHADRSVDIQTPYFLPGRALIEAIMETAGRGVRVRLLVPGPYLDKRLIKWASLSRWPELLDAGVEVFEYQPTMLHAKTVVVDREISLIGSPNFDERSLALNDEVALLVESPPLARALSEQFAADLVAAHQLTPESIRRVPWWKRAACSTGLVLRRQL